MGGFWSAAQHCKTCLVLQSRKSRPPGLRGREAWFKNKIKTKRPPNWAVWPGGAFVFLFFFSPPKRHNKQQFPSFFPSGEAKHKRVETHYGFGFLNWNFSLSTRAVITLNLIERDQKWVLFGGSDLVLSQMEKEVGFRLVAGTLGMCWLSNYTG